MIIQVANPTGKAFSGKIDTRVSTTLVVSNTLTFAAGANLSLFTIPTAVSSLTGNNKIISLVLFLIFFLQFPIKWKFLFSILLID